MKWTYPVLYLLLLSLLSSCGIFRNFTKTVTKTEVITKIDTIYKVKIDTVTITKEAYLTDTVVIENTVAVARSYYNPVKNKIVVELRGKVFDLPIKINQRTFTDQKIIKKEPSLKSVYIVLLITIGYIVIAIISYKLNKKFHLWS